MVTFKLQLCLLVTFMFIYTSLSGQESKDISFFKDRVSTSQTSVSPYGKARATEDKNAFQNSGAFLFGVYRNLISSQDGSTCVFHPTCSSYCRSAIQSHGLLLGGIMTLDRFARCHHFSAEKYTFDMSRRKLVDNVE